MFLARTFGLSESLVRRDINYLLSLNRHPDVKRVHGGIILDMSRQGLEYMFEFKLGVNHSLKVAVAKKALEFVDDEDDIIVDSGTTCLCFSRLLGCKKSLKVVVLDIKIAEELGKNFFRSSPNRWLSHS